MKKFFMVLALALLMTASTAMLLACNSQSSYIKTLEKAFAKLDNAYAFDFTAKTKSADSSRTTRIKVIDTEETIAASIIDDNNGYITNSYFLDGRMHTEHEYGYARYESFEYFLRDYTSSSVQSDMTMFDFDAKIRTSLEWNLTKYTVRLNKSAIRSLLDQAGAYGYDGDVVLSVWLDKKDNLKKFEYDITVTYQGKYASMKASLAINALNSDVHVDFPDTVLNEFSNYEKRYDVRVIFEPHDAYGSFSKNSDTIVGGTVSLDVGVKDGYAFLGWFIGDEKLSSNTSYSFTMLPKNYKITAKFVEYEGYKNTADGVVKYFKLGEDDSNYYSAYSNIVYDSVTEKYAVLFYNKVEIYDASMTKLKTLEPFYNPTVIDADNGILAIAIAGEQKISLFDLNSYLEIGSVQTGSSSWHPAINSLALDGDVLIYVENDSIRDLVFYSISARNERAREKYFSPPLIALNRADHLLYVTDRSYYSALECYDTRSFKKQFEVENFRANSYSNNAAFFDGKYIRQDENIYDKLTGELLSTTNLNRYYNELEDFTPYKSLCDGDDFSFVLGNIKNIPQIGVYDNINERYIYCFDFTASSLQAIGGGKYFARNDKNNYVALIDLSLVPNDFKGNIPPVTQTSEITEFEGFARLDYFEEYTFSIADDKYVYLLSDVTFTLSVFDIATFEKVYSERFFFKPICIDAYDGRLAIGFESSFLFRVYDTTDFTYVAIKAQEQFDSLLLYDDNIIYSSDSRLFVYESSTNKHINLELKQYYLHYTSIAINREDRILYVGAKNYYNLYYIDLNTLECFFTYENSHYDYESAVYFDGEFVHLDGATFDKKSGDLVSDTDCARTYNVNSYSKIATICDDNEVSIFSARKNAKGYMVVYDLVTNEILLELELKPTSVQKTSEGFVVFSGKFVTLITL